jgi:L-Ala-D/L-Glu epimerase
MRELTIRQETWPIRGVFRISRGSRTEVTVAVVEIREEGVTGRGESVPYSRYRETVAGVLETIESIRDRLISGMTREELQQALPPGAARNAVDCALWDLEAKKAGKAVWQLAGLAEPRPVTTAVTLSVDTPEKMAEAARAQAQAPLLKVKLGGEGDLERLAAVREGAPAPRLIVDANEAWTPELCREFMPHMARLKVELVEQPLPAGQDEALREIERIVPICADESCHTRKDLVRLAGLYDFVNIKLDKTGGLTEALLLAREAQAAGFGIMIGCMLGTSLAMAPAVLLTSFGTFVDLDGPLLLDKDRDNGLSYDGGRVHPAARGLWG